MRLTRPLSAVFLLLAVHGAAWAQIGPPIAAGNYSKVTLTDGATVSVPVSANALYGNVFTLLLSGTGHQILNPTGAAVGQTILFQIQQPNTGGPYTLGTWGSAYGWANGSPPVLNSLPNSITTINCSVLTATPTLYCLGPTNGAFGQRMTYGTVTAPASTAASTMMGLSNGVTTITPDTTGNLDVDITGTIIDVTGSATPDDGVTYQISYGMNTGPANGAALTGTQVCLPQTYTNPSSPSAIGDVNVPFATHCIVPSLVPNQGYWFDLAAEAINNASHIAVSNVTVSVKEIR